MDDVVSWLALKAIPGVGNLTFKRLLDRFASPQTIFHASLEALLCVDGVSRRVATAIQNGGDLRAARREAVRIQQRGYQVITLKDRQYPPLLREIPDPPPVLFVNGSIDPLAASVAVVGSRHATDYGISITRKICRDLAQAGVTVVSGLARGVDTAAHEGSLSGKGRTVAVLGSGLERIYPAENQNLARTIAGSGAVVTELGLDAGPDGHNFPKRNRIISGMCLGTLITEATKNSGSLITARLALEQNRDVFAIPGSVRSFKSTGTHSLIKQGAKLVENARDILDELAPLVQSQNSRASVSNGVVPDPAPTLNPDEAKVLKALGPYPTHIDDLVRTLGMESGKLSAILLQLELTGIVRQLPGKCFVAEEMIK